MNIKNSQDFPVKTRIIPIKKLIRLTIFISLVFILLGCTELVCDEPYIVVGSSCCLDVNNNNICDQDDGLNNIGDDLKDVNITVDSSDIENKPYKQQLIPKKENSSILNEKSKIYIELADNFNKNDEIYWKHSSDLYNEIQIGMTAKQLSHLFDNFEDGGGVLIIDTDQKDTMELTLNDPNNFRIIIYFDNKLNDGDWEESDTKIKQTNSFYASECHPKVPYLWGDGGCYTVSEEDKDSLATCPPETPYQWEDGFCYTVSEEDKDSLATCPLGAPHLHSNGLCTTISEEDSGISLDLDTVFNTCLQNDGCDLLYIQTYSAIHTFECTCAGPNEIKTIDAEKIYYDFAKSMLSLDEFEARRSLYGETFGKTPDVTYHHYYK